MHTIRENHKENYQKLLDRKLEEIKSKERVPTLLLHACCAPCSSYVLEYLSEYFAITVLFYNPNIEPEDEYRARAEELKRLIREMPFRHEVVYLEGNYEPERFHAAAAGYEEAPEGGPRCARCFRLRLKEAAEYADRLGMDYFTTTLTISPLKNAQILNRIGAEIAESCSAAFLPSDFKKRGGYQRSIELSREYDLYRQNFCGCVYSKSIEK